MPEPVGRFARVKLSSLHHRKFRGLTAAERGAWLTGLLLAHIAHPEPIELGAVEHECGPFDPTRLLERGLWELVDDDSFVVHDIEDYRRSPSDEAEATRERKRAQRERDRQPVAIDFDRDLLVPVTPVTSVTSVTNGHEVTDREDETREEETTGALGPLVVPPREAQRTKVRGFHRPFATGAEA